MIETLFIGIAVIGQTTDATDWRALMQNPFVGKPTTGKRLPPLAPEAELIKSTADWNKARAAILARWMGFLGTPPAKPASLVAKTEAVEKQDGFTRRRVSFTAE